MSDEDDIPILDDLIEKGIEITLSDLGLDDDPPLHVADVLAAELAIDAAEAAPLANDPLAYAPLGRDPLATEPLASPYSAYTRATESPATDPLADNPALEQAVRRILDEHMELAWQEIRLAIQQHLDRS